MTPVRRTWSRTDEEKIHQVLRMHRFLRHGPRAQTSVVVVETPADGRQRANVKPSNGMDADSMWEFL